MLAAANVKVYKYHIPNAEGDHWIEFTRADLDDEYQAMDKRKEKYLLRVNLWSLIPGEGDDKAATAETNVLAWVDAIKAEIKDDKTMNGSVDHCEWMGGQIDNQTNVDGRWCFYVGVIQVTAFGV